MTIKFYLIRHTLQSLKQAGFDWRPKRERIKQVITAKLQTVNHILTNGLDVGTLIEHRIPVNLLYHPIHGWCFDAGKKYGLYPVLDKISKEQRT